MQIVNGSAMARVWVLFEHVDNLPLVHYQMLAKEIQMVQQQYIIAELGDLDVQRTLFSKGIHIAENRAAAREALVASASALA